MSRKTVAIVVVGDEVLSAAVDDLNSLYIARQLKTWGADLRGIVTVPDVVKNIAETVRRESRHRDVIITTGGVGPTHDDITLEGVARAFRKPLKRHKAFASHIQKFLRLPDGAYALRMADIPEGAKLLWDDKHDVPVIRTENVYSFPGYRPLLKEKLPLLAPLLSGRPLVEMRLYTTSDEDSFGEGLARIARRFKDVKIGSYPDYEKSGYRVMIHIESDNPRRCRACEKEIAQLLGKGLVRREP